MSGQPCGAGQAHCQLCSDEAERGRVESVDARSRMATVVFEQHEETVALDLVDALVGDEVLVHMGFAIARVNVA